MDEDWNHLRKAVSDSADHCTRDRNRKLNNAWFDLEFEETVYVLNENRKKLLNRDTRQNRKEYHDASFNATEKIWITGNLA